MRARAQQLRCLRVCSQHLRSQHLRSQHLRSLHLRSLQRYRLHAQAGLSLVELLVALALGLGVSLAGATLLAAAYAQHGAQMDAVELDDGGRYALAAIGRALRQGSYVDWEAAAPAASSAAALSGLDSHSLSQVSAALEAPLADAIHGSDVLAVRYPGAGNAPAGDGSVLNCAGFGVSAAATGWSIFYVARNASGVAELRCKYRGSSNWSADAIVAGVDGFQVLYGLDTDSPADGVPNRYVRAGAIAALDAALILTGASAAERAADLNTRTWWKHVVSVRVALLLHGAQPSATTYRQGDYALFGSAYAALAGADDPGVWLTAAELNGIARAPARRLFSGTFALGAGGP